MFLTKRSNGIWYVVYHQLNGKRTCISTKTKLKGEAKKFLSEFSKTNVQKESVGVIPIDLQSFRTEYLKYSETIHRPKTTKLVKTILTEFMTFTSNLKLHELSQRNISEYIQHKAKVSPYTAQQHLAYLSSAFNKAINQGYLRENPCNGIRRFKLPEKLPVYFTKDEFQKLLDTTTDNDLRNLFIFAVNTGLRQMELLRLEWNQIDMEGCLLYLDNRNHLTKSKRIRTLPLNNSAVEVLRRRINNNNRSLVIFTYQGREISQDFISHKIKKIIKKAGVNPQLNFHSLRHTFASWLVQAGVSIYEVSKLLGHSDIKTTEIYAHLEIGNLHEAVKKL